MLLGRLRIRDSVDRAGHSRPHVASKLVISLPHTNTNHCQSSRWLIAPVDLGRMKGVVVVCQLSHSCTQIKILLCERKIMNMQKRIRIVNTTRRSKLKAQALRPSLLCRRIILTSCRQL